MYFLVSRLKYMITKKDIDVLKETFATKEDLQDGLRDVCDLVRQENQRMKKEIIREIVDVVTIVMNRIENHEARLVAIEAR